MEFRVPKPLAFAITKWEKVGDHGDVIAIDASDILDIQGKCEHCGEPYEAHGVLRQAIGTVDEIRICPGDYIATRKLPSGNVSLAIYTEEELDEWFLSVEESAEFTGLPSIETADQLRDRMAKEASQDDD